MLLRSRSWLIGYELGLLTPAMPPLPLLSKDDSSRSCVVIVVGILWI
jgi:hypothetical protein